MASGKTLRGLRKRQGLTLKELGALCGISGDELARYERGEKNPRRENTAKIAAALQEPIDRIKDGVCWTGDSQEISPESSALYDGFLQLLREACGPVEAGEYRDSRGVLRACWTVGRPPDRFTLYENDLAALADAAMSLAAPLVEHIKDTRPEKEIIQELLQSLPDGPPPAKEDRFELTDAQWGQVRDLLPPEKTGRGRAFKDNRLMLNGILFWLQTGVPWRDLPERYGRFRCVYDRLRLWNDTGVWPRVLARLLELHILEESSIVVDSVHFSEPK